MSKFFCIQLIRCLTLPGLMLLSLSAQGEGPEPIGMPDIRANIIKMLQDSKGKEGDLSAEEDLFSLAEEQQTTPAADKEEKPKIGDVPKDVKPPATAAAEVVPAAENKPPVRLPAKEIVIEDTDDLKKLLEELQKAKKRQSTK